MKTYLIVIVSIVLLLCAGCGQQEPVQQTEAPTAAPVQQTEAPTVAPTEETVPPTTAETVPVPELTMGTALADETPALLDILMRGDTVDVVGEYDEGHYVIETDLGYGLVQKELLRLEGDAAYEVWTGYAKRNAKVYGNYRFLGEPVQKLKQNTKVEVLDDLGYCCVVRVDDAVRYMDLDDLSKKKISSDDTGADGGDISLQNQGSVWLLAAIEQAGTVTGQAVVLADGTEVILGYFNRGEEIPIVAEAGFAENWEGYVTVYLNGLYAYVPQMLVLPEGAAAYAAWDGYSKKSSKVYDNFYLLGDHIDKLSTNTKIHVLAEIYGCYLVEVDGIPCYMKQDSVSKNKISTEKEDSDDAEWSPPAM